MRVGRAGGDPKRLQRRLGGREATDHLRFCAGPCAAPIIPLQGELRSVCSRCSARYCTTGLANTVGGTRHELARYCSRDTLTPLPHVYLVKLLSLLPGPARVMPSDRYRAPYSNPTSMQVLASWDARIRLARTV